ncbi:nitrite reductase large subunit [Pedobacter sp. SD-b]|uniref:Nitrite reductase large subunit n=1 Tax=Pedobacter segetis TaxID=2793069 RepID=A0ABS1BNL7_9SPHI|nr:nitrite reductase large subunit NirB [Pedobacter segetis]MBK0384357.1 nitrite reductase large subunit [Pedobacter segetis]
MSKKNIIIIGNGMVGHKFCEKLVSKTDQYQITVFGEEPRIAYDRVHLSSYFDGKTIEDLSLSTKDWYLENHIDLILGDAITEINRTEKTVHSHSGITKPYHYLVLATGSAPFVPDIPGIEKEGVFVYRTIEDLDKMKAHAAKCKSGAVMGGGLLGLEAAKALLDLGIKETHVIEFASRLMPRQIDDAGSKLLQGKLSQLGLQIHLNKNTSSILGENEIKGLAFADDSKLDLDMLVISAGIRPRDEIARLAGLEVSTRGGIVVNEFMQTSDKDIFAIGECALYKNMIYGLVAPGYEMAEVAASHLCNIDKQFHGFDMSTKLKLIGVDVASFGDAFVSEPDCTSIIFEDTHKGIYKRINITNDGKQLLGGILIGDADAYNMLLQTVNNKIVLPPNPEDLILGARGGEAAAGSGVMTLPDDALICSCEAVSKGAICDAVTSLDINTIDGIKKCTKAGTGCGGCIPIVKDLITGTMKENGVYVKNVLCEHFDYSRQELLDLAKMNKIKSYDQLLDTFGKGDGCEVCKPAVASILASLWNDLILKQDTIQDSNDRFLANIQKGGTYSVVPRIPGGEITPDKLIVIGQIAKEYGLYTKITGGQRIDLFGAHLSDLPVIWSRLIDAGFESGHAYGKSLRTVKSCVGSTWCRFGLHDSVSFAIQVEDRYKGLRSPHKLKGGVSGCIRECAEAQSKDFGIIATEKGWNLYVCGNGGSKPKHAQLLATDIDSETCIKYLDRFLMFYIRTADPLTRTATWLDKMEGGMAYLKNVVVNDSLGIATELEAEMEYHVNTYTCEWKAAIENPDMKKRFNHFVNAPEEKDPTVKFEGMRDQIKAGAW